MRRALLLAVLAAGLFVAAGCHSSPPHPAVTTTIPASKIRVPLESARTPKGARGADRTHYLNGTPNLTFTGSSIRIDASGAQLIEGFENVYESRYCPYWDPYGHVWTRGFGETDWSGNFGGRCISHSQAEANVRYLVDADYQHAVRGLGMNLNQCQVDALDDFVWNLGAGIFTGSLRYQVQHREWSAILGYDIAGGVVLSGLRTRRHDEYDRLTGHCGTPRPPKPVGRAQRQREYDSKLTLRKHERSFEAEHHCRQPPFHYAIPNGHWEHACHVVVAQGQRTNASLAYYHKHYGVS